MQLYIKKWIRVSKYFVSKIILLNIVNAIVEMNQSFKIFLSKIISLNIANAIVH